MKLSHFLALVKMILNKKRDNGDCPQCHVLRREYAFICVYGGFVPY